MRDQKGLYFPFVSAQNMDMTKTDQSCTGKPSIFVTRRWPADAGQPMLKLRFPSILYQLSI